MSGAVEAGTGTPPPAAAAPSGLRRLRDRLGNPWGRPRFLVLVTWVYVLWSILPVLVAVQFSFNAGKSRSVWQGFSTRWYWDDPVYSVWNDPTLRSALEQSLKLAALDMLIATPIGVALALGLTRWRGRGARPANFLMLFPLVTPEIVMGVALFLVFVHLFTFVHLGTTAQVLGHVTFSISYVVVIVRGRLVSIGRQYEEAAADLGAPPWDSLRRVLLPLLLPAILASLLIVFAVSIDDFVISAYLSSDASTDTVPIRIYSTARAAPTPAVNALATLMVVVTLVAATAGYLVYRAFTRSERTEGAGGTEALREMAAFDL